MRRFLFKMPDTAIKLEKLLIEECSAVDAPANLLDGWIIAKAAGSTDDAPYYAADEWSDADKATWTTAYVNDLPDSSFAHVSPGGEKDSEGKTKPRSLRHLPYKDADGKVDLPHVRAALSRLGDPENEMGGVSDEQRKAIVAKLQKLLPDAEKSLGAPTTTTLGRIRDLLRPARKDDIEMTSEELTAALDERDSALVEKFAEVVKSAVVPVEGASGGETPAAPIETPAVETPAEASAPAEEATGLSVEDVTKAIQDAFEPYNEILEKTLDRVERIEAAFGIAARKSLEGQEDGKGTPVENTTTPEGEAGIGIVKSLLSKPIGAVVSNVENG